MQAMLIACQYEVTEVASCHRCFTGEYLCLVLTSVAGAGSVIQACQ